MISDLPTNTGRTAGLSFDLGDFRKGKGVVTHLPFPDAKRPTKTNEAELFKLPISSVLGTPRYFAIKIAEVTLPNEPLITVSGSKTIVKTQIAGGDFTVKEIIGMDDWKINIQGRAVREGAARDRASGGLVPDDYPEEWLRSLVSIYRRGFALDVQCQLLTYFNISRIVIEDISFPAVPGAHGFFYYEINASSDESSLAKLKIARTK
ncbi:DUF6046 domain-containing protein [Hymenobacter sp. H14-R3]|uniref:DUF6046 domain-containing protein n=1 Tax=Hymenobacter sp. H14-R3 TaxID=3046308 RepID=UPI0024BACE5D|nr:DUF6046 domain-containing protein [Hymenobacter sp. H14-R3]MDJ0363569.1 DUF6046 domain-containing protein [Hymenobacter sp. H14-R3]